MKLYKRLSALALTLILSLSLAVPALAVSDSQTLSAQTAAQAASTLGGAVSVQYALWQERLCSPAIPARSPRRKTAF